MRWTETIDRFVVWAMPVVLLAGAAARVAVWYQNHALALDEANLALNICARTGLDFFRPLDHEQYAPPLFCALQKSAVSVFGCNEYALRLWPLLCSLAALYFFYRLVQHWIATPWLALIAVWIFSFSDIFVRYAAEGKQYSGDVAVALALVWLAVRPVRLLVLALAGAVAVWLSMPAVFVLAGVGAYLLLERWRNRSDLWSLGLTLGFWLLSFGVYYGALLRPSLGVQALMAYHTPWFFPLFPQNTAAWRQMGELLRAFPYYTAGHTVLALVSGALGILTGLGYAARVAWMALIRRPAQSGLSNSPMALLLALPVFAAVLASGLKQYSLIPRMLLWAFPLVLLLQTLGWEYWWRLLRSKLTSPALAPTLAIALFIAVAGLHRSYTYLWHPYRLEEVRAVLDSIRADFRPDDLLYVHHEAWPAVAFYRQCHDARAQYQFNDRIIQGTWDGRPTRELLLAATPGPRRVWLVYSHVISEHARQYIQTDLELIRSYGWKTRAVETPGAYGYMVELQ